MVITRDGRARLRCDLGSRSQECIGKPTLRRGTPVLNLQIQLQRHCSGLPGNFADGVYGVRTRQALLRFQRAYGLTVDGVYGPETARALSQSPNGRC
ncbi:peptidoglycan-binding domain-containing protein [Yoonia sp. 2307UL14-13]|uniref:peptidoglycan-binding domain-containing protein n=1 Tax=Yoonia sp. 2307UL14-13 TaxID=3126506 RepID=UPI00403FEB96